MVYVRWGLWLVFWTFVVAIYHYTLPHHDVVRIADTYEKRVDFGENSLFWSQEDSGNATGTTNRDVFFIQTFYPNDKPMIYRNEDTGWNWPPYFKFDTSNLQANATDLKSTKESPKWVVVKHYGWRIVFWSIYPNAVNVWETDDPDAFIIPWLNIVIITLSFAVFWAIRVRWIRFRERRIDPVVETIGDNIDAASDSVSDTRGRFSKWLGSWREKPRR